MDNRFLFNAIVSSYYDIDTPENYEEFEPQIYLENVDLFSDEIGIDYDRLLDAVQKQLNLEKPEISQVMQHFEDNSNSNSDEYITIKPDRVLQCTGLKDRNGNLIFAGDIVTYYHNKKKLVPVTDRKPFEAPYGNDEETGLPLQYRTVKVIRYKGYVSIDAIGGMELNLRHNLHWWKSLEKDILTQVEVIGNIYENKELLESEA